MEANDAGKDGKGKQKPEHARKLTKNDINAFSGY